MMKTILAILFMTCIGAAMAMWVGMHSAELAEKHFNEVNRVFEEVGIS